MTILSTNTKQNITNISYRFWIGILLLGFLTKIIVNFVFLSDMPLISDAASYYHASVSMSENFSQSAPFYWPPGATFILSAFMSIFGYSEIAAKLFTIVVCTVYCLMVPLITASITSNLKSIKFSAILSALYPPIIMMSGQPYSHHFTALFILAAVVVFLNFNYLKKNKNLHLILLGFLLAAGALTRPSALTITILFFLFIIINFKSSAFGEKLTVRLRHASYVIVTVLIFVFPVLQMNSLAGAGYNISTNNERNFFLGNNRYTPNYKTSHFGQVPSSTLPSHIGDYLNEMRGSNSEADRKRMTFEAINFILNEPWIFVKRTLNRVKSFWGVDYVMSREIQNHYDLNNYELAFLLLFEAGGYCLIVALFLMSLFVIPYKKLWQPLTLLFVTVAFYQAPYALAFSAGIYHFPIIPILIVIGSLAFTNRPEVLVIKFKETKTIISLFVIFSGFIALQIEYLYMAIKHSPFN